MSVVATRALQVVHDQDPKETLWQALAPYKADLDGYVLGGSEFLVAVYIRPEKTRGGLILTHTKRDEDKYQGIVGLVIKLGPMSFVDDKDHTFKVRPKVGDWVQYRVSETVPFHFGETQCRFVEDVHFKAILPRPDIVY